MKELSKKVIQYVLRVLAQAVLHKYKPQVIGVTGSIGKTSTKEAIFAVLSPKFKVRRNTKNYNNEIGLPLTILGLPSGNSSLLAWIKVLFGAIKLVLVADKNFPEFLILEMGVDHVGDMKYLTSIAPCNIGVVTKIAPVHLEYFKSLEKIAKEKSVIVSHLDSNGWAILNYDNELTREMKEVVKGRTITFGLQDGADLRAMEVNVSQDCPENATPLSAITGLSFKMAYGGAIVPVLLPNILGEHLIYAALAGAAVGLSRGMNLLEVAQNLRMFKAPKGRMSLISGINGSTIIDDTYNSSPDSAVAAVQVLGKIKVVHNKKIAIFGDMLELGSYTVEGHERVGQAVVDNGVDLLIVCGERAKIIADEALAQGMAKENIFSFIDIDQAGRLALDRIEPNDYVLVKGSQGARMEKVVKVLMLKPERASELLVRQEDAWQ